MPKLLCLLLLIPSGLLFGQPKLPSAVQMNSLPDHELYTEQAVEAMDWLLQHPFAEPAPGYRARMTHFLIHWASYHPSLQLVLVPPLINAVVGDFEQGPALLLVYLAAMLQHQLQHAQAPAQQVQLVGVEAMLNAYQGVRSTQKTASLERLLRWKRRGKLNQWVASLTNAYLADR